MSDSRRSHYEGRHDDHRRRSRSPRREGPGSSSIHKPSHSRRHRSRSRSPRGHEGERPRHRHQDEKKDRHHRKHRDEARAPPAAELPFNARQLHRGDFAAFQPLFGYFLSVQKSIELDDVDEREAKGRWKSFVGKWNRGELAEGWYDPDLFSRVVAENPPAALKKRAPEDVDERASHELEASVDEKEAKGKRLPSDDEDDENEGDDYGPTLPSAGSGGRVMGPGIPSLQDLSLRNEMIEEEQRQTREDSLTALRAARKADRADQKERLDELLPRADPGSRERRLEKRQAVNEKMREFRDKSPGGGGGDGAADESEVMGGGDSLEEHRKMKAAEQKRKSERQTRREEFERAKREEIEARRKVWREKEEGTMSMLKDLAKQRFG